VSEDVPSWAYEKAEVSAYDPRWVQIARAEHAQLTELLAPWLVEEIEHIGSTAVPGLAAKPIIDLMAAVRDPDVVVGLGAAGLRAARWCFVPPELDRRSWRRFFVKPDLCGQRRIAHLHVIKAGHPRWTKQLAFRDRLRNDERLARDYEALKRRLIATHVGDRESYTDAKTEFIAKALYG
jgi:GrpB-like predicted nucleotidyltransferase (UPF0157 family)